MVPQSRRPAPLFSIKISPSFIPSLPAVYSFFFKVSLQFDFFFPFSFFCSGPSDLVKAGGITVLRLENKPLRHLTLAGTFLPAFLGFFPRTATGITVGPLSF